MKLTDEIKEQITQDADLYAKVCNELEIVPASLPAILKRNGPRLLQINVLKAICEFTGLTQSEILEDTKVTA